MTEGDYLVFRDDGGGGAYWAKRAVPTEQEVFGQYVKGALMTMSQRRYRKARREIGAILDSLHHRCGGSSTSP